MWISKKKLRVIQNKIATLEKEQRELLSIMNKHIHDDQIEMKELKEILSHIKRFTNTDLVEELAQRLFLGDYTH